MEWQQLKKHFITQWTNWKIIERDSTCIDGFRYMSWWHMPRISQLNEGMGGTHRILCAKQRMSRTSWSYRSSGTVRLATLSGTYHHEDPPRDQETDGREKYSSIDVSRKEHLHELVQPHRVVDRSGRPKMLKGRGWSRKLCSTFRAWSLEFSWTRKWRKMVRNQQRHAKGEMEWHRTHT